MDETTEMFKPYRKSINVILVIVTTVAFFVMQFWEKSLTDGHFYGNTTEFLMEHGALYAPKLLEGEWYRVVTYLFLHADITHLFHNMLVLYFLGNALEHYLGKIPYLIVYFFSGILAALGSVVYNTNSPVCVGASGAVFGVTGAMLWLVLRNRGYLEGMTKGQLLFFIFLSAFGTMGDYNVDHAAHFFGFVSGFLLAILLYRKPKEDTQETGGVV